MPYKNVEEIKKAVKAARTDFAFFNHTTMKWFNSRVSRNVYGGFLLIESNKPPRGIAGNIHPRRWNVVAIWEDARVDIVCRRLGSYQEARSAVKEIIAGCEGYAYGNEMEERVWQLVEEGVI